MMLHEYLHDLIGARSLLIYPLLRQDTDVAR
ncbi:hypothetical protein WP8S18E11_15080 [Aeromonas veronii]|nr:hypothetical protein WP8S18E11_15080 [Aeromonas veronii]